MQRKTNNNENKAILIERRTGCTVYSCGADAGDWLLWSRQWSNPRPWPTRLLAHGCLCMADLTLPYLTGDLGHRERRKGYNKTYVLLSMFVYVMKKKHLGCQVRGPGLLSLVKVSRARCSCSAAAYWCPIPLPPALLLLAAGQTLPFPAGPNTHSKPSYCG